MKKKKKKKNWRFACFILIVGALFEFKSPEKKTVEFMIRLDVRGVKEPVEVSNNIYIIWGYFDQYVINTGLSGNKANIEIK